MTLSPVMNQDKNPTPASAFYAPKTDQEQSNLIERLVQRMTANPPKPEHGERFLMLKSNGWTWMSNLPEASQTFADNIALASSGILYRCDPNEESPTGYRWKVMSGGLAMTLQTQPHTFGFVQMTPELIADHAAECVAKWMKANFTEDEEQQATAILRKRLENLLPATGYPGCVSHLAQCAEVLRRSAPLMLEALRASPVLAVRVGAVSVLHDGIHQSLGVSVALVEQAAALCSDAINPRPGGGGSCLPS